LFEQRNIEKKYLGFVRGSMPEKKGAINEPIGEHPSKKGVMIVVDGGRKKGKPSLTNYEMLEDFGIYSLVQFEIQSGRTHQIRVHAKFTGHPIICDEIYGDGKPVLLSSFKKKYKPDRNELEEKPLISRLGLHSASLHFKDMHRKEFFLEAPLPKDMNALLQQLRKNRKRTE
jgi:23S rRNA pseudouridine955/2504/2580 synthase/23S rRNA pseudouridine1911/1915/1917 synthase